MRLPLEHTVQYKELIRTVRPYFPLLIHSLCLNIKGSTVHREQGPAVLLQICSSAGKLRKLGLSLASFWEENMVTPIFSLTCYVSTTVSPVGCHFKHSIFKYFQKASFKNLFLSNLANHYILQ